ncbi:hypothetical protein [Acetobacter indonesiensis]|uniref:hypothetical protein n=1 Tax=Acetobacter indonesiensis TaxID=104101 RepID=UPI0020A31FB4|nr:hypothetical protein [Acetobacter indonesiensis]MCP1232062.1 hypothetical protein [Acetobacter indonesiensis]
MSSPIWIVRGPNGNMLDFTDVIDKEDNYIQSWATIIKFWNFEPVKLLTQGERVTDRGIAILTLELAFFEPFGSILTGQDSDGKSQKTFSEGLKYFSNWLFSKELIGEKECDILSVIGTSSSPNIVYSYARCGLMHKMTMQGSNVFVDAFGIGDYAITDFNYKIKSQNKNGSLEPSKNIFLIDPWRLLPLLEQFMDFFVEELIKSKQNGDDLYINFKNTFERTIVGPGKTYLDR